MTTNPSQQPERRPLKSRQTRWANDLARWMTARGIHPNTISAASFVMGAIALLACWLSVQLTSPLATAALFLLTALACQLRLLCNLLDGMVAIEGGMKTASGPIWNELPDRFSDVFILLGLGMAAGCPQLGWLGASLALIGAYVRELGSHLTGHADFSGPLAKPQRMAVATVASLVAAVLVIFDGPARDVLWLAALVIALGTALTVALRLRRLTRQLNEAES